MSDDIQTLNRDAQRRLEHAFRQLEVLILQERLAALFTGAGAIFDRSSTDVVDRHADTASPGNQASHV